MFQKSSLNLDREPWCFQSEGFVLSDALIAIAVVSVLSITVSSLITSSWNTKEALTIAQQRSEDSFTSIVSQIGECICIEEEDEPVEPADTSWNSY